MKDIKRTSDNFRVAKRLKNTSPILEKSNPDVLSELIDTDIRENLPPQMLAVVNAVFKVIEDLDS